MAYLQIERTGGADGLDAIGRFASLQQSLQQGLLQQQLMGSRLQTEQLERQAQQFGLDEAKALAPTTRVLRQLEVQSAATKNAMQNAALIRMPAEFNQQDRGFDQKMALGEQELQTGDIRQRAMNQALREQKDAYEQGKMSGPVVMKMLKDAGVTGLPQAAQDLFQGQIGERLGQGLLQMTQFKQQMDMKNMALQVELAKTLNPWKDPHESMSFIQGIGKLASENPELLKSYKEKLADPELSAIIDGALKGAAESPDPNKLWDKKITEALNSDDPAVVESAMNVQAVLKGGNLRPQQSYDANGQPRFTEDEFGNQKPIMDSPVASLKKDFAKILGPAPSKKQASTRPTSGPTSQPARETSRTQLVQKLAPFMERLDGMKLDPAKAQRVTDAMAMLRTGDRAGAAKLASLKSQLTPAQWEVLMDEADAIDAGR